MTTATNDQKTREHQSAFATAKESADFLAVSLNHIYNMVKAGQIPFRRFGKSVRIPWSWLHSQAEEVAR